MEAYIAAATGSPDLLFAGGELYIPGRDASATEARLYRSLDAGATWSSLSLADEVNGGWDNAIAGGVLALWISARRTSRLLIHCPVFAIASAS